MKQIPRFVWPIAAVFVGILLYYAFPALQKPIIWIWGTIFAYHVVSTLIEEAVKKVILREFLELQRKSNNIAEQLEDIDRKVSAVLRYALEQRRGRL